MKKKHIISVLIAIAVVCNLLFIADLHAGENEEPKAEDASYSAADNVSLSSTDVPPEEVSDSGAEEPGPSEEVMSVRLIEDENLPLPRSGLVVQRYEDYPLRGSVEAPHAIESVRIIIARADSPEAEAPKEYTVLYDTDADVRKCDFSSADNILSGDPLDAQIDFASFLKGKYTFTVKVRTTAEEAEVYSDTFEVTWLDYKKLTPANFRNNYAYALKFFGGNTDKFMFGYRMASDGSRRIVAEKEWRVNNLVLADIFGEKGYVHVDAEPYIKEAIGYANTTFLRVRGNGTDSGIIAVSDLVESFDGAFVPRLVRNDNYVSHHSFGTALDLNASTVPNTLSMDNQKIIRSEVQNYLTYNGIATENGISYHDFEYSGTHGRYYRGVPYTIQNYLIYELAFFRAGFGWGYYFSHNCDAMHYTLTELDPALHEADDTGLRKVFVY